MPKTIEQEVDALVDAEVRAAMKAEDDARRERIRQQVLERQAAEAAERERLARIAQLRARIPVTCNRRDLDEKLAALRLALHEFCTAAADVNRQIGELATEANSLAPLPRDMETLGRYDRVMVDNVEYRQIDVQHEIRKAASEAVHAAFPRSQIDFGRG